MKHLDGMEVIFIQTLDDDQDCPLESLKAMEAGCCCKKANGGFQYYFLCHIHGKGAEAAYDKFVKQTAKNAHAKRSKSPQHKLINKYTH